jgi:hypothetical protein
MAQSIELPETCPIPEICRDAKSRQDSLDITKDILERRIDILTIKTYGDNVQDAAWCEHFNPDICPISKYMTRVYIDLRALSLMSSVEEDDS